MSTIDNSRIIYDLLTRKGRDDTKIHPRMISLRHQSDTIWQYTSGFGNTCYKLIYALYSNGMNEQEASAHFLSTGNILPNTECHALLYNGILTSKGKQWMEEYEKGKEKS